MARTKKLTGAANAALIIVLTVTLVVIVNLLSGSLYGRMDLTEHQINVLTDASKEAVELEGLEIRVYISDNLPDEVPSPQPGRPAMKLLGTAQKFKDKLAEYKAHAGGAIKVTFVEDNVVEEAKKAKIKAFRGKGGTVSEAGFKADEYVLGATFNYKNAQEVFDLALWPEVYEFEITKRLLRVRDKAESSIKMRDVLRAGEGAAKAVAKCTAALEAAAPEEDPAQANNLASLLSGEAQQNKLAAYRAATDTLKTECGGITAAVTEAKVHTAKHDQLARLVQIAEAFDEGWGQISGALAQPAEEAQPQQGQAVLQGISRLIAIGQATEQEHGQLVDSPGRKRIGFVCNGTTFCPFPSNEPLIPQELEPALLQKNPILGQMLPAVKRIVEEINGIMAQVNQGLFRARGFDIVKIDLDADVPQDVKAMVVFGPKTAFTDWQLYQLDQFVMRGGSMTVFLNAWDIDIQSYNAKGEPRVRPEQWSQSKNSSNIGTLLASWGLTPTGSLVLEPDTHGDIALMSFLQTNRGVVPFQAQAFKYPMIPTFASFDDTNPLVRATTSITLPFTSALALEAKPGVTLTPLVTSSSKSVLVSDATFALDPGAQVEALRTAAADGAHVVAAVATGTLPSHFAGVEAPTQPKDATETGDDGDGDADSQGADAADPAAEVLDKKRDSGTGRVLVIGSNLGLEPLSKEAILEGFNLSMVAGDGFDYIEKFREYQANYRNWSNQVQQVQHTLNDNLQFLSNVLDWSIQRDALAELRSKQVTARPLEPTEEGDRTVLQGAAVVVAPALFLLIGFLYTVLRRRRQRGIRV